MGTPENILEVAALKPDYLGFIFFENSARNFTGTIPEISKEIKKTGVFVNATFEFIQQKIKEYNFQAVQLHGIETVELCKQLKELSVEVIKVFSVKDDFDFSILTPYESVVDYFLFDTKGALPGGNGTTFNWKVLHNYSSEKPFILSGGIGTDELSSVLEISKTNLPIYALDLNSKFEIAPAQKKAGQLKEFINKVNNE